MHPESKTSHGSNFHAGRAWRAGLFFLLLATGLHQVPAAPPLIAPLLRIELAMENEKPPKSLAIFAGEYLRVDYMETPDAPMKQVWWSKDDWKQFTQALAAKKIATAGKVNLKVASPEGAAVVGEIEKRVLGPAATKAAREAAERERQELLKRQDLKK